MKDILEKVNRNDGLKVPEGYLDDFAARMVAALPQQEWEQKGQVMPRSWWQRVRPYAYMAAMFMGVWCMMKTFDLMRPSTAGLNFDSNPVLAAAVNNEYFVNDYMLTQGDMNQYELMEDLYEAGFTPAVYDDPSADGDNDWTDL